MRLIPIVLLLSFTSLLTAQPIAVTPLAKIQRHSWWKAAYKIPADSAIVWLKQNLVNFAWLDTQQPVTVLADSLETDSAFLTIGQYIWVNANDGNLIAEWQQVTQLGAAITNFNRQRLLLVYNQNGDTAIETSAFYNGERLKSSIALSGAAILPREVKTGKLFMVASGTDTLITSIEEDNKYWYQPKQIRNWKRLAVIRHLVNIPFYTGQIIDGQLMYRRAQRLRAKQKRFGYVIFNKPVYKPGDTLKLKAWLTDRKEKALNKPQELWIHYTDNNNEIHKKLAMIKPVSAGSYLYEIPLTDSFPSDTRYTVEFRGSKEYEIFSSEFNTEDYTLPDISSFSFKSHQEEVLHKDSLHFVAEAKDANGLPLLDATLKVTILSGAIRKFYTNNHLQSSVDSLFIKDTLFTKTYSLQTSGSTMIDISLATFPKADMDLNITAELINSSNEMKSETASVKLFYTQRKIIFERQANNCRISYTNDGKEEKHLALLTIGKEDSWKMDTLLMLPATVSIHPLATTIEAEVYDEFGKFLDWDEFDIVDELKAMKPQIINVSRADTIGFQLNNPAKVPVYFTLLKGNAIVWQATTSDAVFNYSQPGRTKQLYKLQMRYVLNAQEEKVDLNLYLPIKLLQVQLQQKAVVEPGEKDTLFVQVKDYKNRPVNNVNITAVGQNTQLKEKMSFPTMPMTIQLRQYYEKRLKPFETDMPSLSSQIIARTFKSISQKIGLDSMLFYNWLFSNDSLVMYRSVIESALPEAAVHVLKKGQQEPAYIIYINRKPVWFYGMNATKAFSHLVYPGYLQVAVRTKNAFVQVDSLYMQPYYKHDIILNIDTLKKCRNVVYESRPDTLLWNEKSILENYFAKFENVSQNAGVLLWQGSVVTQLGANNQAESDYIVGPFERNDSINAYKPSGYSFKFPFESGYKYRLSQYLTRMEKSPLLTGRVALVSEIEHWRLGEIIPNLALPPKPALAKLLPYLKVTSQSYNSTRNTGTLQLQWPADSLYDYTILVPMDTTQTIRVNESKAFVFHNLLQGRYRLLAITKNKLIIQWPDIFIKQGGTTCIQLLHDRYQALNSLVDSVRYLQINAVNKVKNVESNNSLVVEQPILPVQQISTGDAVLSGCITDSKGGDGIPGAIVRIKGSNRTGVADSKGCFTLNVPSGKYVLVFSSVGYESREQTVSLHSGINAATDMKMKMSANALNEVIVVGYGTSKKRSLTSAFSTVSYELMGKVAGVSVEGNGDNDALIIIRGANSIRGDNVPLYVVDGVMMDAMPDGLDTSIAKVEILKSAIATNLYGTRAANGVVIITTGRNSGPVIRTVFRDDAYWQPNTITDKQGRASIPIEYPENITGWQHTVYAAANKGRYGRTFSVTKAFKATQGLLSVPQFLLANDSVQLIGKAMNYSNNSQTLHSLFKWKEQTKAISQIVGSNAAITQLFNIKATQSPDTIKASFRVQDDKDHADGEERSIPVLPIGTQETTGNFWLLDGDTTIQFIPKYAELPITLYAKNKLIDLLEEELESLRLYPQTCMEQTANKLWGLLMMKQIKNATGQSFKYERLLSPLLNRILKNQQFDGGWAWWEGGITNLYITTKVLQSLQQQDSTASIRLAKRNGYLFLQNNLAKFLQGTRNGKMPRASEYLEALLCLAEGKHLFNYSLALDTIRFDSLTLHQQWQYTRIKQLAGKDIDNELRKLWAERKEAMTGAMSWGEQSWYWQRNQNASTVVAYKVVRDDVAYARWLPSIKQYFLEQKQSGWYINTVEKAEITALLLKDALSEKQVNSQPSQLFINGVNKISNFPAKLQLQPSSYQIKKEGSGLIYLTTYQQKQNANPTKVDSLFNVRTQFIQMGDTLQNNGILSLKTGSVASLIVSINIKKSAEFVQLEIPIPAGCYYAAKPQTMNEHREYLKDKTVIFIERMETGNYKFVIPLDVRFNGRFSLNPAKAELMYFPTFYGREGMRQVEIKGNDSMQN